MEGVLRSLTWRPFRVPLAAPYHLSFATLQAYAGVWVRCRTDDGRVGYGEAVPLPGYGWETLDTVAAAVAALTREAVGLPVQAVLARCREAWPEHPFAASAVATALEFASLLADAPPDGRFPLNWPVAGDAPAEDLLARLGEGLGRGYRYIKVKVGRDLAAESANVPRLFEACRQGDARILFDANQGFSPADAVAFAAVLARHDDGRLLWFEQPLDRQDWDGLSALCRAVPVPVLLDESVYGAEDLRRAAQMGACGVKLKLFKQLGPSHLEELLGLARSLGLLTVFGNGVATDVGNLAEGLLLAKHPNAFAAPAECNGFCKLAAPLLGGALTETQGELSLAAPASELRARLENLIPEHP